MNDICPENDEDFERLKKVAAMLGEHFDTVQIFTTKASPSGRGTTQMAWGSGNWFARHGQIDYWLTKERERAREEARREERGDE